MMDLRGLCAATWVVLACGCALTPKMQTEAEQESRWRVHQAEVARVVDWRLQGRIAIVGSEHSGVATFYWEQHPQSFSIRIVAPMGRGVVNIQGEDGRVFMQDVDGQVRTAELAEVLIRDRTGWSIPLAGLQKWVLGIPDEQLAYQYTLNDEGCLATLVTQHWRIEYQRYRLAQGLRLPQKLRMQNGELSLKLVVTEWESL